MPKPKSTRVLPPIRVRQEPPTVEEAIVAAQTLTPDLEQQVEIAAGLMGLSAEAVRPCVLKAPPLISSPSTRSRRGYSGTGTGMRAVGPSDRRATIAAADHCAESVASDGPAVPAGLNI